MRRPLDRYYTPDDLARACVGTLPCLDGLTVLEPSAGGGAFIRALRAHSSRARLVALDIDSEALARAEIDVETVDFLRWREGGFKRCDWVVGNPPFAEAQEHVEAALRVARVGVAMLLRLAFLESAERLDFWTGPGAGLDEVRVLAHRPSFTGGGTDSAAYGWFVWRTLAPRGRVMPCWDWRGAASRQVGLFGGGA
ncbi:MAG: class I SAM-dependent methyltransferase [Rhodobacteraceae bacterium]|nr:class I SAM-dependent methyltransferase [Paracoccaceae bacterium]